MEISWQVETVEQALSHHLFQSIGLQEGSQSLEDFRGWRKRRWPDDPGLVKKLFLRERLSFNWTEVLIKRAR